jgi:hypothetical protein
MADRATSLKVYCRIGLEAPKLAPKNSNVELGTVSVRERLRLSTRLEPSPVSRRVVALARLSVERDAASINMASGWM